MRPGAERRCGHPADARMTGAELASVPMRRADTAAAGGVDGRRVSACCCSASTRWRRVRRASTTGWSRSVRSRSRSSSSASCGRSSSLRGVDVDVVGPRDATVGDRITLALRITGRVSRLEVRLLDPPGEWRRTVAPGSGELVHIAARRGVFRVVRVEVRSGGPLGVFLRRRTLWVRLPVPVSVGPRPIPMVYEPSTLPIGMAAALASRPGARAATRSARCGPTRPATRRASCTGRPARAPASSRCASSSRPRSPASPSSSTCAARRERRGGGRSPRAWVGPRCGPARRCCSSATRRRGRSSRRSRALELGRRLARATAGRATGRRSGWPTVTIGAE